MRYFVYRLRSRRYWAKRLKRELRYIQEAEQRCKEYEREDTIHLYT